MDKWLTQFNNYDEYENFLDSQDCPRLNVSYVVDDDQTYYFKDNTSTNFFTMKFTTDWHDPYTYISLLGNSHIDPWTTSDVVEYAKIRVKKNGSTKFGDWKTYQGDTNFDTGDIIQLSVKYKDEYLNTENTCAACLRSYDENKQAEFSGNIMSMIYGDDFLLYNSKDKFKLTLGGRGAISKADNLSIPRIITQASCCEWMFNGAPITSLPKLPAKTIPANCYNNMFSSCQNLTDLSSYKLDAKYVGNNSLDSMFEDCQNLTLPPQFNPITFTNTNPINSILRSCINLQRLPNIDLYFDSDEWGTSFEYIYAGCSSLTDEHERHIRIDQRKNKYRYDNQKEFNLFHSFEGCSSMTKTPKLINFRISNGCFDGCTSLTEIYYVNNRNAVTKELFSEMPQTGTLFYPYFSTYSADSFNEPWRNQWTLQKMWFDELTNCMHWYCDSRPGDWYDPYFSNTYWLEAGVWRDDRMQKVFTDEGPGANWTQYDCFNSLSRLDFEKDKITETVDLGGWTATGDQVKGYDVYTANNQYNGNTVYAVYNPDANWPEFFTPGVEYQHFVIEFATKPSWL